MTNVYCTKDALRAALDAEGQLYPSTDTTLDTFLDGCIERASRLIDLHTDREPGAFAADTDTVRYYTPDSGHILRIDEITAVPTTVGVAEDGVVDNANDTGGTYTTWGSTDFFMFPYNAPDLRIPYTEIHLDTLNGTKTNWYRYPRGVKVTGKFGFAAADTDNITPIDEIEQATITQAARLFYRARQGYADTGAIEALGQLRYVKKLDPEVENVINKPPFKRMQL